MIMIRYGFIIIMTLLVVNTMAAPVSTNSPGFLERNGMTITEGDIIVTFVYQKSKAGEREEAKVNRFPPLNNSIERGAKGLEQRARRDGSIRKALAPSSREFIDELRRRRREAQNFYQKRVLAKVEGFRLVDGEPEMILKYDREAEPNERFNPRDTLPLDGEYGIPHGCYESSARGDKVCMDEKFHLMQGQSTANLSHPKSRPIEIQAINPVTRRVLSSSGWHNLDEIVLTGRCVGANEGKVCPGDKIKTLDSGDSLITVVGANPLTGEVAISLPDNKFDLIPRSKVLHTSGCIDDGIVETCVGSEVFPMMGCSEDFSPARGPREIEAINFSERHLFFVEENSQGSFRKVAESGLRDYLGHREQLMLGDRPHTVGLVSGCWEPKEEKEKVCIGDKVRAQAIERGVYQFAELVAVNPRARQAALWDEEKGKHFCLPLENVSFSDRSLWGSIESVFSRAQEVPSYGEIQHRNNLREAFDRAIYNKGRNYQKLNIIEEELPSSGDGTVDQ